jgi:hypothetical protein
MHLGPVERWSASATTWAVRSSSQPQCTRMNALCFGERAQNQDGAEHTSREWHHVHVEFQTAISELGDSEGHAHAL